MSFAGVKQMRVKGRTQKRTKEGRRDRQKNRDRLPPDFTSAFSEGLEVDHEPGGMELRKLV